MQTIKLNLIPGSVLPVVNVSQYDANRQFALQVYDGASAYDLTGKTVEIRGTKPDGNGFAYDAQDGVVSVSGNTVTISTTQQMTAVGGQTMAELRITSGQTILGTLNFIMDVEPSALSDDTPISETDIPAIERDFEAALAEAEADALKAEGYAVGTQDGTPAQSDEPYYQDNAKYYKEQAEAAASGGGADALKAEGYAVGTQNGVPVTSGSPYYHNNAAYYDTHASEQAYNASQSATAAGNSATAAAGDSLEAEGWAVGEQNGTPVGPTSPYYQNNAAYYAAQAGQYATGGLIFKGSVAFASIPTTGMVNGDMYNITDDFTTDSRFIEGAGVAVKAGADIAYVAGSVNKWDILALGGGGGADALDDLTDVEFTSPADGDVLQYDATGQKWVNNATIPQKVAGLQKTGCVNVLQNDATSRVLSGVTWDVDSDKIIQANGTATTRTELLIHGTEGSYTGKLPAGTWKMVGCPAGGSDTTYWWQIRYKDGNGNTRYANETGNGLIITWESTYRYDVIRCFVGGGTTANNLEFKLMLTPDLSATYADYQPYAMTNRELTEVKIIYNQNNILILKQANVVSMHFFACTPAAIAALNLSTLGILPFITFSTFQCRCDRKPTSIEFNADGSILNIGYYASYGADYTDLKTSTSTTINGMITYICK